MAQVNNLLSARLAAYISQVSSSACDRFHVSMIGIATVCSTAVFFHLLHREAYGQLEGISGVVLPSTIFFALFLTFGTVVISKLDQFCIMGGECSLVGVAFSK